MQILPEITGALASNLSFIGSLVSSLAQISLSAALTYVTYRYWKETQEQTDEMQQNRRITRRQTKEMRKTREANFRPVIRGTIRKWTVSGWVITVANTGKGAAEDLCVEAYFEDEHLSTVRRWTTPLFTSKETKTFTLPLSTTRTEGIIEEIGTGEGKLRINFQYSDNFGNTTQESSIINVLKEIQEGDPPGVREEEEQDEFYKEGRELLKGEFRSRTVHLLEKHGEMTVTELQRVSGIHRFYLDRALMDLQYAGIVRFKTQKMVVAPHLMRL